ncbi:sugar kinase [Aquabacterium sp.]|uniref:sugar kinase n=1 Tax=Aquabacterium sp. TaxID=1872578 RepID=UPI002C6E7DA0|nr:sugar kinase [Aquabacterium sp.]HSW07455.1 sugar kinase [Aquabacterium sp.]
MTAALQVALFGECMLELQGQAFGAMRQTFGGDTLNTAVYLARLAGGRGLDVMYATGLGDDSLSDGLLQRWQAEGVSTRLVRRIPGRMPGLYLIEVDERGERRFSYWRDTSAAKAYFETPPGNTSPDNTPLEDAAGRLHALYFSGISLAILPPEGRARLFALAQALRKRGAQVVFDNNYRPRLWPDPVQARDSYARAFELASLALVTADDHQALHQLPSLEAAIVAAQALPTPELVIKRGAEPTLLRGGAGEPWQSVATEPVPRVVDTTAAGDSFAAGYLARRLLGAGSAEAAAFGNRLAARVIQHPGALIEPQAMQDLLADEPG